MTHTVGRANAAQTSLPTRPSPQAAVAELGRVALGGLQLAQVLDLTVDLVTKVLGADSAWILRHTPVDRSAVIVAASGLGPDVTAGVTTVSSAPDTAVGFILASSEPVFRYADELPNRFVAEPVLDGNGTAGAVAVAIPGIDAPWGVIGVHTDDPRQFTTDDADFLRSIANIISATVRSDRAKHRIDLQAAAQERRLRYQSALASCAHALLSSTGVNRLPQAVEALLNATQANYVFVERNHIDPEHGLCSRTIAEIERDGGPESQMRNTYWDLVPWHRMPISRRQLESGKPFVVIPELLEGIEREQYAADPIPVMSELNIPIFVDGKWDGLIGFSETMIVREWTPEDISLLTTAAAMIGAFWEREQARENQEELLRAKDQFLASVSHELRTPLTAVVGFGEILRDSGDTLSPAERQEFLEVLIAQGSDVTNIVSDLLVAAKADVGTLEVMKVAVNLRAQTAQVLEAFHRDQLAHIDWLDLGDPRAVGDPDRIRQIVRNLITNGLRYGGDQIHIEMLDGPHTGVLVCDNGPGISTEDRERIFEPYQRAHNAPGVAGSLGLGLSISRKLARLMDGDLTYRHENNQSIFELALPRAA